MWGILNINKPPGMTSRDVVNVVQRLVRPHRAGHAGTLDPLATGVLVVCVGTATRLIEFVQACPKRYDATFRLGRTSATDDIEGEVEVLSGVPVPTRSQLEAVLPQFLGAIMQRPPAYSALKVQGRRAYDLARRGETVELAPRRIVIHALDVVRYEYPELNLRVACGSGTYIRALGRDIAAALDTSAVMAALERTAVGPFSVESASPLEQLCVETLPNHLHSPLRAVEHLPHLEMTSDDIEHLAHGRSVARDLVHESPFAVAIDEQGRLLAVLRAKSPGRWQPYRNFVAR